MHKEVAHFEKPEGVGEHTGVGHYACLLEHLLDELRRTPFVLQGAEHFVYQPFSECFPRSKLNDFVKD